MKELDLESGLLETYVMGLASPEEEAEVQQALQKNPALRLELDAIESSLEQLAQYFGNEPDKSLRAGLETHLFPKEEVEETDLFTATPGGLKWWKFSAIAASIAMLLAAGFGIWGYQNLLQTQNQLAGLRQRHMQLQSENQRMYVDQVKLNQVATSLSRVGVKQVVLQSMDGSTRNATLLWNPQTKEVWLVNSSLPALPEGKQYQMWGIVDGKPVDAGVFDSSESDMEMMPLKSMGNPSMFAVTVENRGGSPQPSLNTMCLKAEL